MSLKLKSSVLQVRVDPDLLAEFQAVADSHHVTASEAIRQFMRHRVLQARSAVPSVAPARPASASPERPPTPLKIAPTDKKQRRADRKAGR